MIINNPHFLKSNDSYYCYHFPLSNRESVFQPALVIFDSKTSASLYKKRVASKIYENPNQMMVHNDVYNMSFKKLKNSRALSLSIQELYIDDKLINQDDFLFTGMNYFVYFDFEETNDLFVVNGTLIEVDYEDTSDHYLFRLSNYLENTLKLKYNNDRP